MALTVTNELSASLEGYLEAIFRIIDERKAVRPIDIARRLNVRNASVTGALRSLAEKKLINYAPYGVISLTPTGATAAKGIIRKHEILRDFFINVLSVEEIEADKAACLMEHSIPKLILERLIKFAEFIEMCPRGGTEWLSGFGYKCDSRSALDSCEHCNVMK